VHLPNGCPPPTIHRVLNGQEGENGMSVLTQGGATTFFHSTIERPVSHDAQGS